MSNETVAEKIAATLSKQMAKNLDMEKLAKDLMPIFQKEVGQALKETAAYQVADSIQETGVFYDIGDEIAASLANKIRKEYGLPVKEAKKKK